MTRVLGRTLLAAYRWQYIVSGVKVQHFDDLLKAMITDAQAQKIGTALAPLLA